MTLPMVCVELLVRTRASLLIIVNVVKEKGPDFKQTSMNSAFACHALKSPFSESRIIYLDQATKSTVFCSFGALGKGKRILVKYLKTCCTLQSKTSW